MTPLYAGIGGVVRELTEMDAGINGVVTPLTEMWAGVDGVNRQIFSSLKTIGSLPVGSIVTIKVKYDRDFIIVHQGKPSSSYADNCSGTWLLQKLAIDERDWSADNKNAYENSSIHEYLNTTFLNFFQTNVKNAVKQVNIPYRKNGGLSGSDQFGSNGLKCKVFLLSACELGWSQNIDANFPNDGAVLDYFSAGNGETANQKRIAYDAFNTPRIWWTRSPTKNNDRDVFAVTSNGSYTDNSADITYYLERPCFILPQDFVL